MIETNGELTYGQQWHRQGRGTDGPCPLQNVFEFNLIVFPVTTTSVERSFSILKWLKIYLGYKTGEERLTTLALMTVHKETSLVNFGISVVSALGCHIGHGRHGRGDASVHLSENL